MDRKKAAILLSIAAAALAAAIAVPLEFDNNGSTSLGGLNATSPSTNIDGLKGNETDNFRVIRDPDPPKVRDPGLRVEKVLTGLALPTSMAFLDRDDVLILQKENGRVRLVSNGSLQESPILDVLVKKENERGLLGIAVANDSLTKRSLFLYYTEDDVGEIRNRVYRYDLSHLNNVGNGDLILDLPGTPGPNHDGGKLILGPDGMLYAIIGDLNRNGMLQNFKDGPPPDDTSVIVRVDKRGMPGANSALTSSIAEIDSSLSRYYAYGIRNSFGMDFDPLSGILWDTENGPADYDEINIVRPGFNSGWERVMGPIERTNIDPGDLVRFDGSHYADPVFSWRQSMGVTDIEFLNSTVLGERYAYNLFVGDFNNGNLYFFNVSDTRDGIEFDRATHDGLLDLVADNGDELETVTFGSGFGGITDIETGQDGYLYILSLDGDLYRIVPNDKIDP